MALGTVEQRRRDRAIAVAGELVADRTHVVVDPENLLDHHEPALRIRRSRQ